MVEDGVIVIIALLISVSLTFSFLQKNQSVRKNRLNLPKKVNRVQTSVICMTKR